MGINGNYMKEIKDRILVDGVWYVREKYVDVEQDFDVTDTREFLIETDTFMFEVVVLNDKFENNKFGGWFIQYTDKEADTSSIWDHEEFFVDLYDDPKKFEQFCKNTGLSSEEQSVLWYCLDRSKELGWL